MQRLPGKQPLGMKRGQTAGPPARPEGFRREVQSVCTSIPAHPVLPGGGVLAWGSVPCRAWPGGLDSEQWQWGLE